MRKNYLLLTFTLVLFLLQSCFILTSQKKKKSWITKIPTTQKLLDIPVYEDSTPFVYWHFCKQKEHQLSLNQAEVATDSLLFRMWVSSQSSSKGQNHGLIEIRKPKDSTWIATVTHMKVDFIAYGLKETITKKSSSIIIPDTKWQIIVDSLELYNFSRLESDERSSQNPNSAGYQTTAPTYSFEYATNNEYRFYQMNYYNILENKIYTNYLNAYKIINLLDREFKADSLASQFF